MELSYWELKSWFKNVDYTIVGSGIVGLNCALTLKHQYPDASILILEKGILPQGASTKNAGFACFGSLSEIVEDLKHHTEDEVYELIQKRWQGLQLLRSNLGDTTIDYQQYGGYELFGKNDSLWEECSTKRNTINELLHPIFKDSVFSNRKNSFQFSNVNEQLIFNQFEGQLDTGKMMLSLLKKVQSLGIRIINNCNVENYHENQNEVIVNTSLVQFTTSKLLFATNGFAVQFIEVDLQPARAQVLITKPIKNLKIKGTFHFDRGYYYFRNIDDRILLGGGRNLDFRTEETTEFGQTVLVQNKLEKLLQETILPNTAIDIEHRWSGIMGVGSSKKPIVKKISDRIGYGVRLGGMGVAIGSNIGHELAELMSNKTG